MTTNTCPSCNAPVDAGDKFCANCGCQIPTTSNCPKCNSVIDVGDKFCAYCGQTIQSAPLVAADLPEATTSSEAQQPSDAKSEKRIYAMFGIFAAVLAVALVLIAVLTSGPDVYVVGHEKNDQGKKVATLWKNGKAQHLSDGKTNASANSVFVSGKDVYVAGYVDHESGYYCRATLWKNGVLQQLGRLTNSELNSRANSVYVSGNNVYVVGSDAEDWGFMPPILWLNGEPRRLGNWSGNAMSVFVLEEDVYVAGNSGDDEGSEAIIWKNSSPQQFKNLRKRYQQRAGEDFYAYASSVCMSGSDVYVTLNEQKGLGGQSNVTLLKNNKPQYLIDINKPWANSVHVAGNDVFVAGLENYGTFETVPMLWENGTPKRLSAGKNYGSAESVYVFGKDVYVAGYEGEDDAHKAAVLWKKGLKTVLGKGEAKCVFVK